MPMAFREGQTAVNKQTGQRLVYNNGQWRPMQQAAPVESPAEQAPSLMEQVRALPQELPRQAGLAARNIVTGVTAVPGMAADAAMALYNLASGSRQQMPTEALQQAMTQVGVPEARTGLERGLGMVQSALAGAKVPMPAIGRQAPANFQPAPSKAERAFSEASKAGYVVPPASVRPTTPMVALESIAGKAATQQVASGRNQEVTNALAAKSLGLSQNQPITREALSELRENAGQVYKDLKSAGRITADRPYFTELRNLKKASTRISKDFPEANIGSAKEIKDLVDSMRKQSFDAESAIEYMKELRKAATDNLSGPSSMVPANKALGRAQRNAAEALEGMVERHLTGINRPDLARKFDEARRTIAKTYTVEGALETTGNVNAAKLAALLKKGKPLSPELETAASFAGAFPKAAVIPERFGSPGVSALDAAMTAGGAVTLPFIGQSPFAALAYPAARYGARNIALSQMLQRGLTRPPMQPQPELVGAAAGAMGQ